MQNPIPQHSNPGFDTLATWQGRPSDYWQQFTKIAMSTSLAQSAQLYWKAPTGYVADGWQLICSQPAGYATSSVSGLALVPESSWPKVQKDGLAIGVPRSGQGAIALLLFELQEQQRQMLLFLHFDHPIAAPDQLLLTLSSLRWLPRIYEQNRQIKQSQRDATRLAQMLETLGRLIEVQHLDQAGLILCNDLSERFACESVSLSWRSHEGLKIRAISHTEKIDRRSELTSLLEEMGEESLQLERELSWPSNGSIQHAHERYARLQQPGHLYTLPLIDMQQSPPVHWGSLTLERQKMAFSQAEQWALRLYADLSLSPLLHLHAVSRALPIRLVREIGKSLPNALKVRTLQGRRLAKVLLVTLMVIGILPWPYSVSAVATVKTDAMVFVGSPFDGFLESSAVQLGDTVSLGQPLFTVSTKELLLERASIQAEMVQANREAEKRRAANQLPEMQMAEAQLVQLQARLQQTLQRLEAAAVTSPLSGVVIEGEPGKNIGGAVRRGDTIVKVAAMTSLYVEAAVSEQDLSRIQEGQSSRVTLLARPSETYGLTVQRVIPQASVVEGVNAFPVRFEMEGVPDTWWRPGMSGVAKIFVGWRPLVWIASHRLIDYLRVALWI